MRGGAGNGRGLREAVGVGGAARHLRGGHRVARGSGLGCRVGQRGARGIAGEPSRDEPARCSRHRGLSRRGHAGGRACVEPARCSRHRRLSGRGHRAGPSRDEPGTCSRYCGLAVVGGRAVRRQAMAVLVGIAGWTVWRSGRRSARGVRAGPARASGLAAGRRPSDALRESRIARVAPGVVCLARDSRRCGLRRSRGGRGQRGIGV